MEKYNGPKSKLMDQLIERLEQRTDPNYYPGWGTMSLYLARACRTLEQVGWQQIKKDT